MRDEPKIPVIILHPHTKRFVLTLSSQAAPSLRQTVMSSETRFHVSTLPRTLFRRGKKIRCLYLSVLYYFTLRYLQYSRVVPENAQ